MSEHEKQHQNPGEIMKLEVPVTASILLFIAIVLLTFLYIKEATWRPGIKFFGASAGIAAGVLSAFYVGRGLKITIEQRDRLLADDAISRAFVFVQRWNDPNFASLRSDWRELLDEIEGKTGTEICSTLKGNHKKRTTVADVLNFFEEMSYAAKSGVANEETLRLLLPSVVERYFSAIWPWVERLRTDRHQPTLYEHFEWLRNKWKN